MQDATQHHTTPHHTTPHQMARQQGIPCRGLPTCIVFAVLYYVVQQLLASSEILHSVELNHTSSTISPSSAPCLVCPHLHQGTAVTVTVPHPREAKGRKPSVAFEEDTSSMPARIRLGLDDKESETPESPRYGLYILNFLVLAVHFVVVMVGMISEEKIRYHEQACLPSWRHSVMHPH